MSIPPLVRALPFALSALAWAASPVPPPSIALDNGASLVWLQDDGGGKFMPRSLFPQASAGLFEALSIPPEGVPSSVGVFLLDDHGAYALFDAGLGSFGGHLAARLEALSIPPSDIRAVFLTHLHPDHIAGLLAPGPENAPPQKAFPNAEIFLARPERDAWLRDASRNRLQKSVLDLYAKALRPFDFGDPLPFGVSALDAAGHTPGHAAFRVANAIVVGDLLHGLALQLPHPEISSSYDMDPVQAAEVRRRLLDSARENGWIVAGMHLPPPGFLP